MLDDLHTRIALDNTSQQQSHTAHPPSPRDTHGENATPSALHNQTTSQLSQTFNLIKQEIQHNILSHFSTFSLQEFHNLLEALLAYISHKEQQYRRIPRKILERYIERFLPTLNVQNGATGSGASFVSFIVNQMKRMKQASETSKKMDLDLFGRLVGAIIRELMGRYVVPVPLVRFLEEQQGGEVAKQTTSTTRTEASPNDTHGGKPEDFPIFPYPLPPLHTILSKFDKNFVHYKHTSAERSKKQHIQNLVAYTQDVANLIYLRKESERTKAAISSKSLVSVRPMSEQDNGVNRSSLYSSRYTSMTHGGVGPLEFNIPLYRDPQRKLMELEHAKKTLVHRLEALEQMVESWDGLNAQQKEEASNAVRERLHAIHHTHRLRKMMRQLHGRELNDSDLLELYEETYTYQVIHHANLFHRPVNRHADYVKRAVEHQFPAFLRVFESLTDDDVQLVQNVDTMYKLAFRDGWLSTLRQKYKDLRRIPLGEFKDRILSGLRPGTRRTALRFTPDTDPLLRESALFQLMSMIREDVERPQADIGSADNASSQMPDEQVLTVLYSWIVHGYPNEVRVKTLQDLLQQTVKYISEDAPVRFGEVEEYLLRRRLRILKDSQKSTSTSGDIIDNLTDSPPPPGIAFGLEFVHALRDMFEECGDLRLIMSPQEAYKLQTEKQVETMALQELDEHLDEMLGGEVVREVKDQDSSLAQETTTHSAPRQKQRLWNALLEKSTFNELNRQKLFHQLKSQVTREEEERLQMQFNVEHASMAIPNKNIITSNHYTWLEQMRQGWAPNLKKQKRGGGFE